VCSRKKPCDMVSATTGRLRRFIAQPTYTPDSQLEVTGNRPSRPLEALSPKDLQETAQKILDQAERDELCTYIVNEYGPYAQCKPDGSQNPQASATPVL